MRPFSFFVMKPLLAQQFQKLQRFFPLLTIVAISIVLLSINFRNKAWEGGADNYWHYYFSRYAFQKPEFFLHHWGKPLFIALSVCFSQFGFFGTTFFNLLCGILCSWIVYKFCKQLGYKAPYIGIVFTVFTPVYFLVIQSAMTEPLFSLVFIYASYLIFTEKYIAGAIVASFLMYARTEGVFFIIIYGVFYLIIKRWKYLPFFSVGFLLYSLIGYLSGHDFFWFFTENPYKENSPYGHGDWDHFFKLYQQILGTPLTILFLVGIIFIVWDFIKKPRLILESASNTNKILWLILIPSLFFSLFHIYAWAEGKYASYGLYRVFASVTPAFSIVSFLSFNKILEFDFKKLYKTVFIIVGIVYVTNSCFIFTKYPIKAYGAEKAGRKLAKWLKKERKQGSLLFYAHPAVVFFCDFNPFDEKNKECHAFPMDDSYKQLGHFYYVWDTQFSEFGCKQLLSDFTGKADLKLVKIARADGFSFYVFEYLPAN